MRLESIQIGSAQPTPGDPKTPTGIFKEAVGPEPVAVTLNGLTGDVVSNLKHHGGPDQAIYVYTRDDYQYWEVELGRPLAAGLFGENLTIEGLESADVMVGDRFAIGDVVLEATSARVPCNTFQARMEEPDWVSRFRSGRRPGVYARVVQPGRLAVGNEIDYSPGGSSVSILETLDLYYDPQAEAARLEEALKAPIASRNRSLLLKRLGRDLTAYPFDLVRSIALALPEVNERISHGASTFFIRNKKTFLNFAVNHHGDGRAAIWCSAPPGVQEELVELEPDRFYRPPYVGHRGWIGVRLDAEGGEVNGDELTQIITEAYRNVAPKTLIRQIDASN